MVQTPTLVGTKVRLRPVEERDMPLFALWFTDPDVMYWLPGSERPPHTLESLTRQFETLSNDDSERDWIIETLDGQPIGDAGLKRIEPPHGRAELFISIGEKECWSQGYGEDAVKQIVREAFDGLGLRRVSLETDGDNARAIRCYEKCGFVREGLLREHRLRYGEPLDQVRMGVLRSEWESRQ